MKGNYLVASKTFSRRSNFHYNHKYISFTCCRIHGQYTISMSYQLAVDLLREHQPYNITFISNKGINANSLNVKKKKIVSVSNWSCCNNKC